MRYSIEKGKKIGQNTNPSSLRGPLTESEMQKVVNFYLKMGGKPQDQTRYKRNWSRQYHPSNYA